MNTPARQRVLELHGVYQHVAGRQALADLDLRLDAGDWLLVVGPNGAGKTLLMRLLLGLDAPSAGTVRLLGTGWRAPGADAAQALRRRVGAVLQGGALLANATVLDNLLLPLRDDPRPSAERARAVRLAMTLFQLDGLEHHRPERLSPGQRRQVELARALVHQPECLIWDGLSEALDTLTRRQILQTLDELRRHRGLTLVATAHDPQALAGLEHRLAVLDQGRLLFFGAPAALAVACRADERLRATLYGIDTALTDMYLAEPGSADLADNCCID